MLLNSDYYTPAELTGFARTALLNLPANQFRLAQFLPDRTIDDLVYRFTKGGDTLLSAAPFRSYDAESSIAGRAGVTRVSGELPPISRKIVLGEYDRLRRYANPTPGIQAAILSDAERVVRQIAARLEVARGDALVNGSVTINENGVVASVDYGRDASMAVTAGTLWSNTGASDPISDLTTWTQAYVDLNGQAPGVLLTSTRIRGFLLRNAAIRALAGTVNGVPTQINPVQLNGLLDSYDLPQIAVYDVKYDVAGTATRVIADNVGLLLPPAVATDDAEGTDLGGTFFGTTAESLDASYALEPGQEPGIVAGSYRSEDPISLWTKAAAIALPVLANANLSMKLTLA
jgi:hypothetical protein